MSNKKIDVLVYSGNGSTVESVRHCVYSLRRLLSPHYAVIPVTGDVLVKEPWMSSCALLVIPGGADAAYCRTLDGEGNRRIKRYVQGGGAYLGFCAGGYYGSKRCEFEVGSKRMEVIGDRELAFFPGICRGLAFPGFVYNSEAGARAVELSVNSEALGSDSGLSKTFRSYYNGGGVFVDAQELVGKGVEVLASYTEPLKVDSGEGAAAVIFCKSGSGRIILTGPHPEFAGINLSKRDDLPEYSKAIDAITADDAPRVAFLRACLRKLGLEVNSENHSVPSLSRLHLSSFDPSTVSTLLSEWSGIISKEGKVDTIRCEMDTFRLEYSGTWDLSAITSSVKSIVGDSEDRTDEPLASDDRILDYEKLVKRIAIHESDLPSNKETPYFSHHGFFSALRQYASQSRVEGNFGKCLLYGEVVTSTSTLLEKNVKLLNHLPHGFTATATTQVAGRGRGSNVWVTPPGALMFSTVIRHPLKSLNTSPVVFIQYLAALAIVDGIKSYGPGYSKLPIKLKWPNDVYALRPEFASSGKTEDRNSYAKIAGILVNSSYAGGDFTLVVGIGVNVANALPTTALNLLAKAAGLRPFSSESLLASILAKFENIYQKFCRTGWDANMEEDYYKKWLHTDQIVTIESEGGLRARVKGITRDWGLLVAEELGYNDIPTGKKWQLQSDSNSFDFFKGLLKRKI
ncbi:class II aaRS and biotin synthetase [Eremomyces bilateralis CBS 781.70]|uniref:Class II aaRS and biotin synthetase n=1 Tax=Eremomyces bilateralis CBS 781.70 TaxID=1392243 RepID=A0A6G1GAB8_9PEZI|nr:class II aaRS and biotin synthetase [Eremomyces bilateralis CBS 781.70]KAF1814851.1 class II aaRS and biotin synthetase [Eremomyces bilateralis CBS 781.70]